MDVSDLERNSYNGLINLEILNCLIGRTAELRVTHFEVSACELEKDIDFYKSLCPNIQTASA